MWSGARTAFTNLSSLSPVNDDEEVLDLILREMIHIKLNMYPPIRYTGGLSYAEKFDSVLHFFAKEKVEEIREKMEKLIEVNRRLQ